jgi:hypothetical protein
VEPAGHRRFPLLSWITFFIKPTIPADVPRRISCNAGTGEAHRLRREVRCPGFRKSGEKHRRLAVAKKDKSKKANKLIKKAKKMMKKAKKEMKKLKKKEKASNTKVDRQDAPPTSPFSS